MWLLDTNVVSEIRKVRSGRADPNVARWIDGKETASMFISVITLQELETGVLRVERRDARKGAVLRRWLDCGVRPAFVGRILPVDEKVALRCAGLHVPDPRPFMDSIVAATALVHDLTLVTRNVRDFFGTGVKLLDPWEEWQA